MPTFRKLAVRAVLSLFGISLLAACDATQLGMGTQKQLPGEVSAQARGIHGVVLDAKGAPAAGVQVRGTLLSNSGSNLVSNSGANLISNGASLYRTQSGYQTQSGFETKTGEDGKFAFNTSDDQILTLEAIQRETMKAIQLGAAASDEPFTLRLAPTGNIQGEVNPADPAITDLLNVDVFIPGTSYIAKTDAQGNYLLSNVPKGRFTLVADHQNLGRAVLQGVTVASGETLKPPALELSTHTPVLSGITPANGAPGSTLTLSGDHFGISSGKRPEVLLNGVSAQIVAATDTQIKALIPLGSVSGTVRVSLSGLESATKEFRVLRSLSLFPNYREADASNPVAQAPSTDVLAIGASRRYFVRAFDTEGRLIPSPAVSWSTLGSGGTGFSNGTLTPQATGRLAIAAVSGSLSTLPLAIEIVPRVLDVTVLPNQLAPLNPRPLTPVPEAKRSAIPDSVKLQAKVLLEGLGSSELPFLFQALDPRLTVSADGLVSVVPGAADGEPKIKIIPIADPTKSIELVIPVKRQGDLSFVID